MSNLYFEGVGCGDSHILDPRRRTLCAGYLGARIQPTR